MHFGNFTDMKGISLVFKGFKNTDTLGDCRKSPKMAILAIPHVMKSITYKY